MTNILSNFKCGNIEFICILNFILILYLLYRDLTRKEGFALVDDINTAINTRYGADVAAIKNLSDIATKLTTSGGLVVPGSLISNNGFLLDSTGGQGLCRGRGTLDGATFTDYNTEVRSWWGTGFRDTSADKTNVVIDHRTGDIITNGALNLPNDFRLNGDGDGDDWLRLVLQNRAKFHMITKILLPIIYIVMIQLCQKQVILILVMVMLHDKKIQVK